MARPTVRWGAALGLGAVWWWAVLRLVLSGDAGVLEGAVAAGGWGLSLLPVHCVPKGGARCALGTGRWQRAWEAIGRVTGLDALGDGCLGGGPSTRMRGPLTEGDGDTTWAGTGPSSGEGPGPVSAGDSAMVPADGSGSLPVEGPGPVSAGDRGMVSADGPAVPADGPGTPCADAPGVPPADPRGPASAGAPEVVSGRRAPGPSSADGGGPSSGDSAGWPYGSRAGGLDTGGGRWPFGATKASPPRRSGGESDPS